MRLMNQDDDDPTREFDDLSRRLEILKAKDAAAAGAASTTTANSPGSESRASLPPPVPRGKIVPTHLLSLIEQAKELNLDETFDRMRNDHLDQLATLVKQRNGFGMQKYGQPLYSEDGRNGLEDARQELGDLIQYVCKVNLSAEKYTRKELTEFLNLFNTAAVMIKWLLK